MGRRRLRVTLVAVAVLAQLGAGVAVVIDLRHDRQEDRERAATEAAARRAAEEAAAAKEQPSTPERSPEGSGENNKGGRGLLDSLLGALGLGAGDEGGAPSLPGLSASVLTSCGPALTDALPDSGPKLLPDGKESSQPAAEQLPRLAADVEELRGLRFTKVPAPAYVSAEEMARRVVDQTNDQLPPGPVAAEARILIALGALPAGADLAVLTRQALSSQVAGFYDPDTGDLVVRGSDRGSLDGQTRIILSHELDHALTDQALGLPVDDQRPAAGAEDAALAQLALVEGDATLVMQLYGLAHVSLLEQLSGLTGAVASQEELARLPYYMQRSLTAPYLDGMGFACALYSAGGWDAVNQAYKNLPTTSAQVLFPERYRAGEKAVDPRDPPALGGSWQPAPVRALGAAELQWLFEAPGGDTGKALDHVTQRAAAWAGGEVHQWTDGPRTATAVDLVQRAGETPLCASIAAWYTAAFPGGHPVDKAAGEELAVDTEGQDAVVRCARDDVRVGIAPDLATARAAAR